jgi:hypothetical protein
MSQNRTFHGQHGHGGALFTQFKKKTTRQQSSTVIKIYGLLAIMVLLRLAPRDCWLVVALGQNERHHGWSDAQQFFVAVVRCEMRGLICARFLAKRSSNVGFGEILLVPGRVSRGCVGLLIFFFEIFCNIEKGTTYPIF